MGQQLRLETLDDEAVGGDQAKRWRACRRRSLPTTRHNSYLAQTGRRRPSLAYPPRERGLKETEPLGDALVGLAVGTARHSVGDELLPKLDTALPPVRRRQLTLVSEVVGQPLPALEEKVTRHGATFAAKSLPVKTGYGEELRWFLKLRRGTLTTGYSLGR